MSSNYDSDDEEVHTLEEYIDFVNGGYMGESYYYPDSNHPFETIAKQLMRDGHTADEIYEAFSGCDPSISELFLALGAYIDEETAFGKYQKACPEWRNFLDGDSIISPYIERGEYFEWRYHLLLICYWIDKHQNGPHYKSWKKLSNKETRKMVRFCEFFKRLPKPAQRTVMQFIY